MKRTEKHEGKTAWAVYMSDGEVNLALLQYKGEVGSGVPKGWTGIHHFGFQCDDIPSAQKKSRAAGGKFFFDLNEPGTTASSEVQGPRRHRLRHQLEGLAAHQGQGEERQGRARACDETRCGGAEESQQKDREAGQDRAEEEITNKHRSRGGRP